MATTITLVLDDDQEKDLKKLKLLCEEKTATKALMRAMGSTLVNYPRMKQEIEDLKDANAGLVQSLDNMINCHKEVDNAKLELAEQIEYSKKKIKNNSIIY